MVGAHIALGLAAGVLLSMTVLAIWATRGDRGSIESYLTARNTASGGTLTATLIASAMGVWILLSPAEAGAAFGGLPAVMGYALGSALPMAGFALLGPRIRRLMPDGHSLTEYALLRYGRSTYAMVLVVSIAYMFVFLGAEFTAIAQAFALIADVPRWQTASLVGVFVLAYTAYGGLRASIVTDTVQTLVILPLLALSAVGVILTLGGTGAVYDAVVDADQSLLDPTFPAGVTFGIWVSLAILGAEMLNQTWWQRIYAATNRGSLRRSFAIAAVANAAVVFLAGLFGLYARGYVDLGVDGPGPYRAGVAFFVLLETAFPAWIVLVVVLLALLLVMSTADTLFNALASIVTVDLPRILEDPTERRLNMAARVLTVVIAVAAIVVSLRAQSVLQLFLFADLLAAAVMIPLLAGLYSTRVRGLVATLGGLSGIAVGLAYFPHPLVRAAAQSIPLLGGLLPGGSFLFAFVGAVGFSGGVTVVGSLLLDADYQFDRLRSGVRRFDVESRPDGGHRERPGERSR